jgi:MFS family permease
VKNKQGIYAARFFLGMMEAGLFPGLAAQLCSWYRSDEMGKPIMWMFGFQNCAGIVGSLIAYGVSYMNGLGGLSGWQWFVLNLLQFTHTLLTSSLPGYISSKGFSLFFSAAWSTSRSLIIRSRLVPPNG